MVVPFVLLFGGVVVDEFYSAHPLNGGVLCVSVLGSLLCLVDSLLSGQFLYSQDFNGSLE